MIRFFLWGFLVLFLPDSSPATTKIRDVVPWADVGAMQLGLKISDFREMRPDAKPMFFGSVTEDDELFSGVYFEGVLNENGKAETPFRSYSFDEGELVGFAWEDNTFEWQEKVSGVLMYEKTKKIREELIRLHGYPETHKMAKIQFNEIDRTEGIAAVFVDLFRISGDDSLRLTLSSSVTGIRAAILELPEDKKAQFFSYDEDVKALEEKGLIHIGEDAIDVLQRVINEESNALSRDLKSERKNLDDSSKKQSTNFSSRKNEVQESEKEKSNLSWIIAGVLLVVILALLFKTLKGKSTG